MKFYVTLESDSPVAISKSRATGNQLQTIRHIPGTVWRGAVASDLIREKGLGDAAHCDREFSEIFLNQQVRFGDLRVEGDRPWPMSTRVCKLSESHSIHDFLIQNISRMECP